MGQLLFFLSFLAFRKNEKKNEKRELPKLGIAPRLPRPQRGVLLLDYFGGMMQLEVLGYRFLFSAIWKLNATI